MTEDEARAAIEARITELDEEDRLSAESQKPVTLQQDSVGRLSRMDAIAVQSMALAAQTRRDQERRKLAGGLARIAAGEWGFCLVCLEEIAEKRLRLDPACTLCIKCAKAR